MKSAEFYFAKAAEQAKLAACHRAKCGAVIVAEDGEIMGLRHTEFLLEGVQFHPESIMTPAGKRMLRNFVRLAQEQTQNNKE